MKKEIFNLFFDPKTIFRLGLINIFMVILHRLGLKTKLHPVCFINSDISQGPFFCKSSLRPLDAATQKIKDEHVRLFSYLDVMLDSDTPDWLSNPITKTGFTSQSLSPWWEIEDFDKEIGDIKVIWELSRFDWTLPLAQRARNGDQQSLEKLNSWVESWCLANPPYFGPNWKCGQESSIRLINLCIADYIISSSSSCDGLRSLIHTHLKRIRPTIHYAIAQNNNHGTSEAVGLFIGGNYLIDKGIVEGQDYMDLGRYWLERTVSHLISDDGSFSQYSSNYHRLMLDTISVAELFREKYNLPAFSDNFYRKASQATKWLYNIVDKSNGSAPNLGANDGARLLQLTDSDYRDFRPTVQLASKLFLNKNAYHNEITFDHLKWLDIEKSNESLSQNMVSIFDEGGYAVINRDEILLLFRYPNYQFRPSHSDALHIDFWLRGQNLFRDSGTYGYFSKDISDSYFESTEAHNTVQFDYRDQMPRLGRFLYGKWIETDSFENKIGENGEIIFGASYTDFMGCMHSRKIRIEKNSFQVIDAVNGFKDLAILRWRMPEDNLFDFKVIGDGFMISSRDYEIYLESDVLINRCEIVTGYESNYYLQKKDLNVLELEIKEPGKIYSNIVWKR